MKKLWFKKEFLALSVVIAFFVVVSVMSIKSISLLQGNARVVNYVGIVRGATQKLIKEELMGWHLSQNNPDFVQTSVWYPNDNLIKRLDSIVDELLTGEGPNNLVVLHDETYLSNMRQVQEHWSVLKNLIMKVRAGENPQELFYSSQKYFELVNETVFSAEAYSEKQVTRITNILFSINAAFVVLIIAGLVLYGRNLAAKKRADDLGKIAYMDHLTGLNNRASCERLIENINRNPQNKTITVFMFDMNDLKLTNDFLGHQGGDRVIAAFAKTLSEANEASGFVGRFGGDEFLVVFESGETALIEKYLNKVHKLVDEYNENQVNKLEKIHYAAGYITANTNEQNIEYIIHEADNRMYANKRKLKASTTVLV